MPKFSETALVKKPYQRLRYSIDQLEEFSRCAHPITGPKYFLSNYFYVQHPTKGKILYKPYEYQNRLIDAYHDHRKVVAMLPRQCGKCLNKEINITIMNKQGEIYVIPIGVFYEYEKSKRDGNNIIDISCYKQTGA